MKKYPVIAALLTPILVLGALVGMASPASATDTSSDANLAALSVGGSNREVSNLQPNFAPANTWYAVATSRPSIDIYTAALDPNATITFKRNGVVEPGLNSGWTTLSNFEVAVTEVVVEVVASDLITKKEYKIYLQRGLMLQPKILSTSDNTFSNLGGDRFTARVQNAFPQSSEQNVYCYVNFTQVRADGQTSGMDYSYVDVDGDGKMDVDNNGVSTWRLKTYSFGDDYVGPIAIRVENACNIRSQAYEWDDMSASSVYQDAATLARPVFESLVIDKNSATPRGIFSVKGLHLNSDANIMAVLFDPAKPEVRLQADTPGWFKDDTTAVLDFDALPENLDGDTVINDDWKKPGKRTLLILNCGYYNQKECEDDESEELKSNADLIAMGVVMHSAQVDYTPPFPSSVSISPNKGALKGGNRFTIKGINIFNRRQWAPPVMKIGGKTVSDLNWSGNWDADDIRQLEVFEGTIPSGIAAGSVPITITTEWGEFTVTPKYTYSGTPVITSIAPASVSNAGGSLVTLTGTGFGTIGNPSVTIDGIKSQCVSRISDTKIVAMVPVGASSGAVDVNVISGAGGGSAQTPGTLNLVASTSTPTATKFTPSSVGIGGGDEIVITGTNFGAQGTVGVTVGGNCARVITSTATSITIEAPSGDAAGATEVVIGATTGSVSKIGAVTYVPNSGVSSITPNTISTTATSAQARVQIVGSGFGASGTIKVGTAAAVAYTSTDSGTKISNILIPTSAVGNVAILITPAGKTEPFYTSVAVKAPTVSYLGPNPRQSAFEFGTGESYNYVGYKVSGTTAGGTAVRIEGKGFGGSGTIKFDNTVVTPSSWTDTEIILSSPAVPAGSYDLQIVPTSGPALPKLTDWFFVSGTQFSQVIISKVESSADNGRSDEPYTFNPYLDLSDEYVVTGSGFLGTDNGATTKVKMKRYQWAVGSESVSVTPYDVTSTSFKFRASRAFGAVNWYGLEVSTNIAAGWQDQSVLYIGNPPPGVAFAPERGLCLKDSVAGYSPAELTLTGSEVFGNSGTVTVDGEVIAQQAITWSSSEVRVNFDDLAVDLVNAWGHKSVVFTPDDNTLVPYRFNFQCSVSTTVTTKLNGSTGDLTIAAGTTYSASAALDNPIPTTTFTLYEEGYEYVNEQDYVNNGFNYNAKRGLPVGAGEYYVRAMVNQETYDTVKYSQVSNANAVKVTITGTPITFTPKLTGSNAVEIFYRGQLGDGTQGTNADISYTNAATPADAVTKVVWEYRTAECNPNYWNDGLPERPAIIYYNDCSLPPGSVGSYDIRVKSFEMKSGATDRSIFYRPTYEIFNLKIKKKAITITSVSAEKVYDSGSAIQIRDSIVSGAVGGETVPELLWSSSATFADPSAGTGKSLTLDGPIRLGGGWDERYELTNPFPNFTGTIKKADAVLSLVPSATSVIMTANAPVEITAVSRDTRNNNDVIGEVGVAPIVLTSTTTSVCTISGITVSILKAGDCIIAGSQAASTNYNAAQANSNRDETIELLTIPVFAAPKAVQVVADDVTVAVGEDIELTSQAVGLIGDDLLSDVSYEFYQGATLLASVPTEPGTYKILPRDASLTMANSEVYNPAFKYVAGRLIITASAPTLEALAADQGPESGGNKVVIKGSNLGQVTSIVFAGKTYRKPAFTVNGAGTEITITAPAGKGEVEVLIRAGATELTGTYTYIPDAVKPPVLVKGPTSLSLSLAVVPGSKLSGQVATLTGSGLKANSAYTLVIGSKKTLIVSGVTNSKGAFTKKVTLGKSSCVGAGNQNLVLTGTKPSGVKVTAESAFGLDGACELTTAPVIKALNRGKVVWTLSGFLFKYRDAELTSAAVKSLNLLLTKIKGAKLVKISGYTETDTKSAEVKAANLILAKDRTISVRDFLKKQLKGAKYLTYGKGGVNPVSLTNQSLNRRVVIEASF